MRRHWRRGFGRVGLWMGLVGAIVSCAPQRPEVWDPAPEAPSIPGFDTARYPGDGVMRLWREHSPYRWVGYYLASPCHRDPSWMGTRARLAEMGWGVAVLYVGQQYFERQGAPTIHSDQGSATCSRALLTEEQAERDARDAVEKARAEGFPEGTIVYLDVEHVTAPDTIPWAVVTYTTRWIEALIRDGRYQPGLYAHHANAPALYAFARVVYRKMGLLGGAPFWVSGGRGFRLSARAADAGYPFADTWQGALDVERRWGGVTLRVDESVSRWPSPSQQSGP